MLKNIASPMGFVASKAREKMNLFLILSIFAACLILLGGCGTKRQYFEPESTVGKVKFDGSLSSPIKEVVSRGASLKNGGVITFDDGEKSIGLEKGYGFLGEFDGKFISSSPLGDLRVKNADNSLLYSRNINAMIASASIEQDTLAVITADNTLYVFNTSKDEVIFQRKLDTIATIDSRIAAPYFLGSLVIFPTLDGRLTIVDRNSGALVRNVVVSANRQFGNVIFLDVINDRMFAATAKRIIGISPTNINYIDEEIKDAVLLDDRIFILTKDGRVLLADLDLKILAEKKFPFAIFAGAAAKDKQLYIVEKRGYLIKTDLDLNDAEIFGFPSEIDDFLFVTNNKIYYNDDFYTLK